MLAPQVNNVVLALQPCQSALRWLPAHICAVAVCMELNCFLSDGNTEQTHTACASHVSLAAINKQIKYSVCKEGLVKACTE